ncbi:fused MFS/spermidine synthase [soil metagenome]
MPSRQDTGPGWKSGCGARELRLRPVVNRNRFLYALVFVVGISTLGAEIAAARLLAPFFGASTMVWANTIGVVLVALSAGYWFGGRFSDRHPEIRYLCLVVLVAAVLLAVVPFVSQPFFRISADALDSISAGGFIGSLVAVLFLIAIPVFLLGTVSPWALRLAITDVEGAGQVAGRLYAISTAGSLLGTMLSALVLIPFAGTQRTFLAFSLVLTVVAVIGLSRRYVLVPLALAGVFLIPVGTVKATDEGKILYEGETEQQYVQVIERPDGERILELNEGQAVHSLYRPGTYLTHDYWDGFLTLPFASLERPPRNIAILGNAAGTIARAYGHFYPQTKVDGVELDPKLSELGREYFDMRNPNLTIHDADARPWLRQSDERYDAIFVDAYRQPYIPFYLATKEFFEEVRDHLRPGGIVIVNIGHPEGNDDLEKAVSATVASVFPNVRRDPAESTNVLLSASESPLSNDTLLSAITEIPVQLRNQAVLDGSRLAPALSGGPVYTDDKAPVEWLIDKSILGYAESQ